MNIRRSCERAESRGVRGGGYLNPELNVGMMSPSHDAIPVAPLLPINLMVHWHSPTGPPSTRRLANTHGLRRWFNFSGACRQRGPVGLQLVHLFAAGT